MRYLTSYQSSLFAKLTVGLTLVPVIVFSAVMLISAWQTQTTLQSELTNQINDDVAALSEIYIESNSANVSLAITQRLALSPLNRAGAHYRFQTKSGETLAGDLTVTELLNPDVMKPIKIKETAFGDILVRSTIFRGGETLTVARETDAQRNALANSLLHYVIGLIAIIVLSALLSIFAVSGLRKRIEAMNRVFNRVGDGELEARLSVQGRSDELSLLAEHINSMIARTARLLTLRKRVTDQVAHEMRSPLTRLDASLSRISKTDGENEAVEQARAELKHCVTLLDGLLDISSLDAQQGDKRGFEPVNLTDLVHSISDLFDPMAEDENKPLRTELESGIEVSASPSQLGRLISNLLDNAVKYAESETPIFLTLKKEGAFAILRVANNGKPITGETARDIFTPFFRSPGLSDKKGYGLGLALSRSIATRHDGFLELESTPKQVVFKLTLPLL